MLPMGPTSFRLSLCLPGFSFSLGPHPQGWLSRPLGFATRKYGSTRPIIASVRGREARFVDIRGTEVLVVQIELERGCLMQAEGKIRAKGAQQDEQLWFKGKQDEIELAVVGGGLGWMVDERKKGRGGQGLHWDNSRFSKPVVRRDVQLKMGRATEQQSRFSRSVVALQARNKFFEPASQVGYTSQDSSINALPVPFKPPSHLNSCRRGEREDRKPGPAPVTMPTSCSHRHQPSAHVRDADTLCSPSDTPTTTTIDTLTSHRPRSARSNASSLSLQINKKQNWRARGQFSMQRKERKERLATFKDLPKSGSH
ncbi:hypothetical protein B0H16DRAFT_1468199 [Mycena metata]|uniref:Uncharacterized protein n=1 Tax=Mycena metata TaxID=1033252 RepID=A0AAD7I3B9_9AGAR|nr:hypothetical protein B0H16DRAFT_1468199 [Mycena metata]